MAKDIDKSDEWSDEDYDDFEKASLEDLANDKDCAWQPCGDEHCEGCDADAYEEDIYCDDPECECCDVSARSIDWAKAKVCVPKHTLYSIDDSPFGTVKSSIELGAEDMATLLKMLKNPPEPNDALKKAHKRYRASVVSEELMHGSYGLCGECPCDHTPNAETIQAMKEADEGKTESIDDMDEYFKTLDAEEYDETSYLTKSRNNMARLQASIDSVKHRDKCYKQAQAANLAFANQNRPSQKPATRTLALALGVCTLGIALIMASVLVVFS